MAANTRLVRAQTLVRLATAGAVVSALALGASAADRYFGPAGLGAADGGPGFWNTTDATWSSDAAGTGYAPFAASGDASIFSNPAAVLINGNTNVTGITVAGNTFLRRVNALPTTTLSTLQISGNLNVPAGSFLGIRNAANFEGGFSLTGGGTLGIGGAGTGASGSVSISGNSTLFYYNDAGGIADIQPINLAAGSTITHGLVNDTYGALTGGGTITGGYLGLGVSPGAHVRINTNGADATFSGAIQGRGVRFNKLGAGTQTLSGTNTFTSYTSITQGTLRLVGGAAIHDSSPVYFGATPGNNATLTVDNSETIAMLAGGNATNGTTNIPAGVTLTVNQTRPYSLFNGSLSGSGTFVKSGSGAMTFANTAGGATPAAQVNNFAGKYVITGGILSLRNDFIDAANPSRIGADPGAPVADYFTLAGGILANNTFGGYVMDSDRGVTVLSNSGFRVHGTAASNLQIPGTFTGAAGVTLTKDGIGILSVNSDNASTYAGNWNVASGTLQSTRAGGSPFGTGTVTVNGGVLGVIPAGGAGIVTVNAGTLVAGEGTIVNLNRGTADAVDFKVNSLVRGPRSTLVIQGASGSQPTLSIGNQETLQVLDFNVPTVGGIVPGVVGTISAASTFGDLLSYDTSFGFKPATYSSTNLDDSANTNTSVVDVPGGGATLTGNRSVFSFRIGNGTVDLAGNTLTAGDGTNPATIVMNSGASLNNGTVDFGSSQGVIYGQNTVGNIGASIAGTNGVTFIGANALNADGIELSTVNTYSGPTKIAGGSVKLEVTGSLPSGTALSIDNNALLLFNTGVQASVSSVNMDRNSQLNLGDSGVLAITGAGNSEIPVIPAGTGTSKIAVTGGGTLILGTVGNNGANNNAADPHGPVATGGNAYDRLEITNGSTVILSSSSVLPEGTATATDQILIDGGTLKITAVNSAAFFNSGASTFSTASSAARRAINVGNSGATIWITEPEEIVIHQVGNGVTATDVGQLITGGGTLTMKGPGIDAETPGVFRIGAGNTTFTGKWVLDNVLLQFNTDGQIGTNPGFNALGADLPAYVADAIVLKNGGGLQSAVAGNISANRGITIDATGGLFNGATGGFTVNSPLSGTGDVRVINLAATTLNASSPNFSGDFNIFGGGLVLGANDAAGVGGKISYVGNQGAQLSKGSTATVAISNDVDFGTLGVAGTVEMNLGASGDFILNGKLSGNNSITVFGSSAASTANLVLAGDNSAFAGHIALLEGGSIVVASDTALGSSAGTIATQPSSFIFVEGGINHTTPKSVALAGSLFNTSGDNVLKANITLSGDAATTLIGADAGSIELGYIRGPRDLTIDGLGDGTVKADYVRVNALTLAANDKLEIVGAGVDASRVTSLVINSGATLNLTQNDLIVDYTGSSPITDIINNWVNGIILANGDVDGLPTYLAIAEAADLGLTEFGGLAVDESAVVLKYTFVGDANLDGQVDALDYERVDLAIGNTGVFGTAQGDLNYDGNVDALDYEQIDLNIGNGVGSPLAGVFIPEPASLSLLALGAGLMGRRRRM